MKTCRDNEQTTLRTGGNLVKRGKLFKVLSLLVIGLLIMTAPGCETEKVEEENDEPEENNDVDNYLSLALKHLEGEDVCFTELRELYVKTPYYDPSDTEISRSMRGYIDNNELEEAISYIEGVIFKNLVYLDFNLYCRTIYLKEQKTELADFHAQTVTKILNAITASGDGSSPENALDVLSVGEEYAFMDLVGIEYKSQAAIEIDGQMYDVFEVVPGEAYDNEEIYFNVDFIFDYYESMPD